MGEELRQTQRLSRKFLHWLVPSLMGVFLLGGVAIGVLQYRFLSAELENKADRTAHLAAFVLARPLWDLDKEQIEKVREAFLQDPEIVSVTVTSVSSPAPTAPVLAQPRHGEIVRKVQITWPGTPEVVMGEVAIQLTRQSIVGKIRNELLSLTATMFCCLATVVLLNSIIQRRLLTDPLKHLLDGIVRNSQVRTFHPVEVRSRDEIGFLTESFNTMMQNLKNNVSHLQEVIDEKERIMGDLALLNADLQMRDSQLLEYQEHLEEQVFKRSEQLEHSRQLLKATLDALPAFIAILDSQGILLATNLKWQGFRNPANGLVSGVNVGEDYRALCDRLRTGSGQLEGIAAELSGFLEGEAESCRREYEFDQGEHQQWFVALATRFEIGDTCHIVLMHLDVTTQKRMEVQLQQAQKLESIGQLAAGIAHEINTPIQFIGDNLTFLLGAFQSFLDLLGPLQTLLELQSQESRWSDQSNAVREALDQADPEFLKEDVPNAIHQSLDGIGRVSKIVNAMKDFSHPGSASRMPLDLNRAIESTALVCRNDWKYVAEMDFDFGPGLQSVPCFPDQFNQVILNLIINAAHAIGDSLKDTPGGKGRITIRTRVAGDRAEIRVEDTGPGIPESIRHRIFDPFFTTKPVGKGTGQGLAIAYSVIVQRHGGTITVASDPGKGAAFILRLPLDEKSGSLT